MISLALAAAAAPDLVQCRMMECVWSRPVSNSVIRSTSAGTLRKVTALRGTSAYRDEPPSGFDGSIPIQWEKRASVHYVLCSTSRPALAFRSGKRWVAHALDLFDVPGYHAASAIGYLRACHGAGHSREDMDKAALNDLGYRPGTRSDQVEIAEPEQLFELPERRRDGGSVASVMNGRGDWIRTSDPHTPSVMRYQAALRPDRGAVADAQGARLRPWPTRRQAG